MATVEEKEARVEEATRARFRGQLLARGQARSIIWRAGVLPTGAPQFSQDLTYDLLSYGFSLLSDGLDILEESGTPETARIAFENAAWAIESVVANGEESVERDFLRFVAAASYHLARYTARAFSLLATEIDEGNLTAAEKSLALLMLRSLDDLEALIRAEKDGGGGDDDELVERLAAVEGEEGEDELDVVVSALEDGFISAIATALLGLERGDGELVEEARGRLELGMSCCGELSLVNQWWCHRLATFLLGDLWNASFHQRLPVRPPVAALDEWGELRELFIGSLYRRSRAEIELWPSQVEAARKALHRDENMVVSLPTSAGKTRIAELCMLLTLARGQRVVFVTPLRALSAQTEASLERTFRPLGKSVSSLYGGIGSTSVDEGLLGTRDIVVSTPEKLDFALRNDPNLIDDVGLIVLDEGHMIGIGEREVRYEVQVQLLLRRRDTSTRRIICLSAVLPDNDEAEDFVEWLTEDGEDEGLVRMDWRPTRLTYGVLLWRSNRARVEYTVESEQAFVPSYFSGIVPPRGRRKAIFPRDQREFCLATAWKLVKDGHSVLIYCPLRRSVEPFAKTIADLHERGVLDSVMEARPSKLRNALAIGEEWLGADSTLLYCLKLGVAVHHGALPTPYRREVERLLREGVLRITISSPTLAQGLNLTASALVFHGVKRGRELIEPKEFRNVVGRAGRAFVDVEGQVLFPMFADERKKVRDWRHLVEDAGSLAMESGIVLLVEHLLSRMWRKRPSWTAATLREYVSNGDNWDFDPVGGEDEVEERRWNEHVSTLDTTVLGLLDEAEISDDEIEERLDEILQSSLWARCLRKRREEQQLALKIGLAGRARAVLGATTPSQRKAYFLAGVGLRTGRFLDTNSERLLALLVSANSALVGGERDEAIIAVSEFAELVFAEQPFVPNPLPDNWQQVLCAWLSGDALGEAVNTDDPDVLKFVEDGLTYRLAWAMEAVRVHGMAVGMASGDEQIKELDLGFAVAAVETGTLSVAAAVLMKAGFGSRNAAVKAVADGEADFDSLSGLLKWVGNDLVAKLGEDPNWPTAETHELWAMFIGGLGTARAEKWRKTYAKVPVRWFDARAERSGVPVRLSPVDGNTTVCSASFDPLGTADVSLPMSLQGVLQATVSDDGNALHVSYIGPEQPFRAAST